MWVIRWRSTPLLIRLVSAWSEVQEKGVIGLHEVSGCGAGGVDVVPEPKTVTRIMCRASVQAPLQPKEERAQLIGFGGCQGTLEEGTKERDV